MNPTKQLQKIFAQINKHVTEKKWKCIIDECNENAINSHLLQKNGILNNIAENGHLIEIKPTDFFSWSPDKTPMAMKSLGINNAFSLTLFCNNHDTSIFKEVETHPLDLENYRNQLLLSYRVVCAEIRKKEINVELNTRILNSITLRGSIRREDIEVFLKGTKLGIIDLNRYKQLFENELKKGGDNFVFKTYKYPLIKIYGSATFSPLDKLITNPEQVEPLNSVFIHVIPLNQNLNILVGYHKNYVSEWIRKYVDEWENLNSEQLELKLTNLFAAHIENWGLSPKIKNNISKQTLDKFVNYSFENALNIDEEQITEFNLFENKNYGT